MTPAPVRLGEKLALFSDHWSPKIVARMDDYDFKLARLAGDFVWHQHPEADETFLVLEGRLRIDFRDGSVSLEPGDLLVVPRGIEHKPCAAAECAVLLIERVGTVNTGEPTAGDSGPAPFEPSAGQWLEAPPPRPDSQAAKDEP